MATAIVVALLVLAAVLGSIPILVATVRRMARRRAVAFYTTLSVAVPFLVLALGILLNPRSLAYFNFMMTLLALGAASWVTLLAWAIVGRREATGQRGFAVLPSDTADDPRRG